MFKQKSFAFLLVITIIITVVSMLILTNFTFMLGIKQTEPLLIIKHNSNNTLQSDHQRNISISLTDCIDYLTNNNVICNNIKINTYQYHQLDNIMTFKPWLQYEIETMDKNTMYISVYKENNKNRLILLRFLYYIQYTSSYLTYFGIKQNIYSDPSQPRCLHRFIGSLLYLYIYGFERAIMFENHAPKRFNPIISDCWIAVDNEFCNENITNKYECYFLPSYSDKNPYIYYNNMTMNEIKNYQPNAEKIINPMVNYKPDFDYIAQFKYISPFDIFEFIKQYQKGSDGQILPYHIYRADLVTFLMRPNLKFNQLLYKLDKILIPNRFKQILHDDNINNKCIAFHYRRGDKIRQCNIGDIEECDFNVTLNDYIGKILHISKQLNNTRNVFMLTDDDNVCKDINAKYNHTQLIFYCVFGNGQPNDFRDTNINQRSIQFAKLYLSWKYAQFCDGFVGNMRSNVAKITFLLQCKYHDKCPLSFSFSKFQKPFQEVN
eukprot:539459_1